MSTLLSETVEVDDDPFAFLALAQAQGWSDGLPLIPPTDTRIEAMLAQTPLPSTHIVVHELPPRHGTATVELVAINAVMAGCEPRAFPLVLAALQAIAQPAFNAFGLATTTGSVTPMLVVNGRSRDALGIDYRAGCLGGSGGRGSATIGRAVQLCLRNIGGLRAGDSSRTVFGQPARVGLCFGEWEERSDWPSLAQRRGFSADQEVVTVHGGMGTVPVCDLSTQDARELACLIARSLAYPMNNLFVHGAVPPGEMLVLLNPLWAERLAETFPRIEDLQAHLHEEAWQAVDLWPQAMQDVMHERGRVDAQGRVRLAGGPAQYVPVVCGGLGNLHATLLPSWGESEIQSAAALRLPQSTEKTT
ncbi:MAG TPA: hypothetical protein VLK85_05785 [Ramlibacter sp.]|nr:hypothetical protein [Ramlibacter sp.]